jgi:hypothetical protein
MKDSAFPVGGMTLEKWTESVGRSVTTAYRWIKEGMLEVTNVLGKFYVTKEADETFWARARAGEFEAETESIESKVAKQQ